MNTVTQNVELATVLETLPIGAALICKINGEVVPAEYQYFDVPNDQIEIVVSFEGELVTVPAADVTIPPSLIKNVAKQKELSEKEMARKQAAAAAAAARAERESRLAARRAEAEKRNQERARVSAERKAERERISAQKREEREAAAAAKYQERKQKVANRDAEAEKRAAAKAARQQATEQRKAVAEAKRKILAILKEEGISRKELLAYINQAA